MERPIKFRAYVENDIIEDRQGEVYQVSTLDWDDDGLVGAVLFSSKTQTFHTLKAEWFKLVEYTGLKDKNGKEIYEGNILVREIKPIPLKVLWNSWQWGCIRADGKDIVIHPLEPWTANCLEVIGNICENPELLNNKELKK